MAKGDITYVDFKKDDSENFILFWNVDTSSSKNQWAYSEHSKVFKKEEQDMALQALVDIYKQKLKLK